MLQVSGLDLSIRGQPILHGIDLTIERGEVLGVIGESGSGKSLLAMSILGLLPRGARRDGRIEFDDTSLVDLDERSMRRLRGNEIAMVFQEPMSALNPLHTIGDQVAESIRLHRGTGRGEASARAKAMLERVGLPPSRVSADRYPHELSGGQRQRVVIAMAVALGPQLLIADEPTTALDVTTQAAILELLEDLVRDQGMGLLLISHDLAVVGEVAERVAIMRRGEIIEAGVTGRLFEELSHPYTRELFEASSFRPARRTRSARRAGADATLLQVESLVCEYRLPRDGLLGTARRFRAVDSVSFEIRRGENVGLVGESGSGKSTLARALLGLQAVSSGRIRLDGDVLGEGGWSARQRQRLQVVFQDPYGSFNPRHRVRRLVAEPLYLLDRRLSRRERRHRVDERLESVGLAPADADKYIHEFSGGQRQRIAIARALIVEPALIVLDEAVSALDVSVRAQILELLARLGDDRALAYLFISHDLSVVRNVTDRVLVMHDGEVVECGDTERVFSSPAHRYTQTLVAATPRLLDPRQHDHAEREA